MDGNYVNGDAPKIIRECSCCGRELDHKGRCSYCWIGDCDCIRAELDEMIDAKNDDELEAKEDNDGETNQDDR